VIEEQEMKEAKASLENTGNQGKAVNPLHASQKHETESSTEEGDAEVAADDDSGIKGLYNFRHHMSTDLS
jgi:hypothetical protein